MTAILDFTDRTGACTLRRLPGGTRGGHWDISHLPENFIGRLRDSVYGASDSVVAFFVFGSYARGEADEESDIDLCVFYDDGRAEFHDLLGAINMRIKWVYRELGMDYDLILLPQGEWVNEQNFLVSRIKRDGVYVKKV